MRRSPATGATRFTDTGAARIGRDGEMGQHHGPRRVKAAGTTDRAKHHAGDPVDRLGDEEPLVSIGDRVNEPAGRRFAQQTGIDGQRNRTARSCGAELIEEIEQLRDVSGGGLAGKHCRTTHADPLPAQV
jgi:hypothetical protein